MQDIEFGGKGRNVMLPKHFRLCCKKGTKVKKEQPVQDSGLN